MEICNSFAAAKYLRSRIKNDDAEEFWAIALNSLCKVIKAQMLFRGTVDSCMVHPRDIYRFAVLANATSLVVGHNHPSGVCSPSRVDIKQSENLRRAGELIEIPLVDHVIITRFSHFSFADNRWRQVEERLLN